MNGGRVPRSSAMHWFLVEVKARKKQVALLVGLTMVGGLVADAFMPYAIATLLERLSGKGNTESLVEPFAWLGLCMVCILLIEPIRIVMRRRIVSYGQSSLTEKVNHAIVESDRIQSYRRGEFVGSTSKFLSAWGSLVTTIVESILWLSMGIIGLVVLMAVRAPIMILVALFAAILAALIVRMIGRKNRRTWEKVTQKANVELMLLDAILASKYMRWLTRILTPLRDQATLERQEAEEGYQKTLLRWQLATHGLDGAIKISAAFIAITLPPDMVGTAFLLVWFSLLLADRLRTLFEVNESINTALGNADAMIKSLETTAKKPPLPCIELERNRIVIKDLRIMFDPTTVISMDWLELRPGTITVLSGPSGCGKSTILNALAGCIPYEGSISYGGHEVSEYELDGHVIYGMQGYEKLDEKAKCLFGENADEATVSTALSYAAFSDAPLEQSLAKMSGGMRRRAYLAAQFYWALKGKLGIVLVDEPTNDLGREIDQIVHGFDQLRKQCRHTVFVVTTHSKELLKIGDQVVEMA